MAATRDLMAVQFEVEQFLFREARLLDTRRFDDWLALLADDVRYWIPIRESSPEDPDGFPGPDEIAVAHLDEDKAGLALRVRRLGTGWAHSETPPTRTRRLVTNVEVTSDPVVGVTIGSGEIPVTSNLLLLEGRRSGGDASFSGARHDVLRRDDDGGLRLARRTVLLDQVVLPRGLSVFL